MIEIIAGIGLGLSALGSVLGFGAASDASEAQKRIAAIEMQQNEVRKQQMETNARRETLEAIRRMQIARSVALTNATSQNAQGGSGLQGGYGQISGNSAFRISGIQTSLNYGRQMFGLDSQISQQKMALADASSDMAFAQGLTSLGSVFMNQAGTISRIGGSVGSALGGFGSYGTMSTYGQNIRGLGSNGIY